MKIDAWEITKALGVLVFAAALIGREVKKSADKSAATPETGPERIEKRVMESVKSWKQPEAPKPVEPVKPPEPPPEKPASVETQPEDGRLGSPFASFVTKFGQPTKTYAGGATWDGVGGLRSLRVYGDPSGANEIRYEANEGYFTFTRASDIVLANSQGRLWSPAVQVSKVNDGMMGMRTIYHWYRSDGGFASFQTTRGAVGDNRAAISYAESDGDSVVVRRPSSDAAKNIENHRKYSMARDL